MMMLTSSGSNSSSIQLVHGVNWFQFTDSEDLTENYPAGEFYTSKWTYQFWIMCPAFLDLWNSVCRADLHHFLLIPIIHIDLFCIMVGMWQSLFSIKNQWMVFVTLVLCSGNMRCSSALKFWAMNSIRCQCHIWYAELTIGNHVGCSCGVVSSTLAFGSIGLGFESEHRLFSHHIASAFSNLRSLAKWSLDYSVRWLL